MGIRGKVFTGARARIKINGAIVGWLTGLRWEEAYDTQPARVLGQLEVAEHVVVAYNVSGTASSLHIVGESLKSQGLYPLGGSSSDDRVRNAVDLPDAILEVDDVKTGGIEQVITGVKFTRKSHRTDQGNMAGTDITWVGIVARDHAEL